MTPLTAAFLVAIGGKADLSRTSWFAADMWWAEHVRSAQGISDVDLFSYREGIVDLHAEVSDGAFFGVAKQKLHGP